MLTRRLADAKIAEFLAQRGAGASTSSTTPVPIPEAVLNPGENNPIYRALTFPVDAPRRGPNRPLHGPYERYLPLDREGRRGRAHAVAIAEQGPPLGFVEQRDGPTSPKSPPRSQCGQYKDLKCKVVRLPTEAELDEGYIFDRDHRAKVLMSTIQPPEGPLTNQWLLNIVHAREVYELLKSDAHHNVSHMTLCPISYIDRTDGEPRER